ncbi:hypothetical protein HN358_02110 [Candidatus Uhrbacteria bacterium]|jgi:hypothetical protein|nr:hypothetical protein [Candidatus Uhrbacteria bacterium]MBT7716898.1 hypothetical protein [Candidatus Uhrbacteria bacterium]
MNRRKTLRRIVHVFVAIFLLFNISSSASSILPIAHANLPVVDITAQTDRSIKEVLEVVADKLKQALTTSLSAEMVNLLSMMANELSYNSAVWIASGGNAESPLFNSIPPEDYFKFAGARVLSEIYNEVVIDNLEGGLFVTLNVYLPTDPEVLQAVRNGIKSYAIAPEVNFDYPDIKNNWTAYLASLDSSDLEPEEKTAMVLSVAVEAFDPDVNEFGAITQLHMYALSETYNQAQSEEQQLLANNGFRAVTDYITHQIFTPASLVKDELEQSIALQKSLPFDLSTSLMANTDTLMAIGINAGTIFTNTLFSELMNKVQGGLFEDVVFDDSNPFDVNSSIEYSRSRIQSVFKSLTSFKPLEITDYSMLSELSTCPTFSRGTSTSIYNCAIDSSFVSAIALSRAGSSLNLQDAIDEGYVDGTWPLIPSADTARNQDTKCYTYGFCHSNLVKLRKARIISIGWELAAESDHNSDTDPVTLQEVVDGFYTCNSDGELDSENPWCHLIDPNWVLKFPETQCRTLAYGQVLSGFGTDQRAQECVDIQSCVSEDGDGNCDGGYGYCVREQNTWKFRGQECPEHYASCMSFENGEGGSVDFLTNTLDYGNCDSSNIGCMWNATQKEVVAGVYEWPEIDDLAVSDLEPDAYQNRLYFNSNVEECDVDDAGCEHLYERDSDTSLNMISNSSFESDLDEDGTPDSWLINGATYSTDSTMQRSGADAIDVASGLVTKYGLVLNQSRYHAISVYVKATDPTADYGYITMTFADEDGNALDMSSQSIDGSCSSDDCLTSCAVGTSTDTIEMLLDPKSDSYIRTECVFTSPTLADRTLDIYAKIEISGSVGSVIIDDIMLEQDFEADIYAGEYNEDPTSLYMKVAPDYLGCTGASDDADECANYAGVCSELEAGCGSYTPVNGDPSVTAVVSLVDQCPSTCDGYDTFRQEATQYEPYGDFPIYLIPSTADTCNESAVGCTEFTNLDTEAREHYTDLRACVTEDQARTNVAGDNASTFYTWEGSDEEGYQLRTWRLLESDLDSGSYHDYSYQESDEIDVRPGSAPCTNWSTDADGITCNDDADEDLAIDGDYGLCDEHSDIIYSPGCREFYDTYGGLHYRLWSETVTVNDACVSYRLTELVGDSAAEWTSACTTAQGYFDSSAEICRFYGYAQESTECSESNNGCRAYTGGRSANSRLVLQDLFEEGTLVNWGADSATTVTLSNESVAVDGHSLKSEGQIVWSHLYDEGSACATEDGCASSTGVLGGSCTVDYGDQLCGTLEGELFTDKTYTLTFWAKGETDLDVGFDMDANTSGVSIDTYVDGVVPSVELSTEWTYYSVGPFDMNEADYAAFGDGTVLAFVPSSTADFYVDNIVLREGEDELTLIKDSWSTPATCDQSWEGATSAQFHLGCQEYTDQESDTWYLKSFRNLCDGDAVGCKSYYTTEQSDSNYAAVYNATCYNADFESNGVADQATESTGCYVYTQNSRTEFDTTSPLLCTIIAGEDHCLFDFDEWFIPQAEISDISNYPELYHLNYGPDATFTKADSDIYLIYDEDLECSSSDVAGCSELGQPTFSGDHSLVDDWMSVYYINDPDVYTDILCSNEELFCKEFESTREGTWYFKDPIGLECEYKTDVSIDGTSYTGWFREGTSEFCYGEGACTGDGITACTNDAQCAVDGLGECNITDGAYLVGGTESGIWRNGDLAYDGSVGHCSAEYDGCSAFEDPLDVDDNEFYGYSDGEMYYYIDDDQIDDSNLLSSQRCNGQVSQKEGCTLFYDSGEAGFDYNASATYVVSTHADEILGEEPFVLVDPIDCTSDSTSEITLPDGATTYDPCISRCLYSNRALTGSTSGISDSYTVGQSCFLDDDCPNYDSTTGDIVSGHCADIISTTYYTTLGTVTSEDPMPRLENDTNRVISVNQDRVCAEWLSCSSSYSIWDQDTGKYRTICDGVDLCTEYSAEGHPSFCSEWDPEDPAVVLDIGRYVSRDVTWYGEEYSGYSVPNVLPIQHLDQIDIAPPAGYCDMGNEYQPGDTAYDTYHAEACDFDVDCGSMSGDRESANRLCVAEDDADYRVGYIAGSCTQEYAEDCAVGYCSEDGSACTSTNDCVGADSVCTPGVCYAIGATTCSKDADCGVNEECFSGVCAENTGYCDLDTLACGSGVCYTSVAYKEGSCYGGACFLAMDGEPFEQNMYEGQSCRAYPEGDSPFGENVISEWNYVSDTDLGQTSDTSSFILSTIDRVGSFAPRSFLAGFENVETCLPGEDCVCSYTKLSNSNGQSVYASPETSLVDAYSLGSTGILGICSAGSAVAGAVCIEDADCQTSSVTTTAEGSATCDRITEENTVYGLSGYCLERDTGLNIEGDQYTGACLTWLPIDQLSGSTDLYAKFTSAGYSGDSYYCGDVDIFTDFYTSGSSESVDESTSSYGYEAVACAETHEYEACDVHNCVDNAACPDGYYAIMGACEASPVSGDNNYAESCTVNNNDCPYVCVPYNAHEKEDETKMCDPDSVEANSGINMEWAESADYTGFIMDTSSSYYGTRYEYSNRVYTIDAYSDFDDMVEYVSDCVVNAVEFGSSEFYDLTYKHVGACSGTSCSSDEALGNGYYNLYLSSYTYPACSVLLQTSDGVGDNYAWTDRVLGDEEYSIPTLEYTPETPNLPFGSSLSPASLGQDVAQVPACSRPVGFETMITPDVGYDGACDAGYIDYTYGISFDEPGALPFTGFTMELGYTPTLSPENSTISYGSGIDSLVGSLNNVFAKVLNVFHWVPSINLVHDSDGTIGEYVEGDASLYDVHDDVRSSGVPPTVWAVDMENCGSRYCEEGAENAITLNAQNTGDFESDEGFFRATVKFFAAAYTEQLPIRRVIVEWGDGDESGSAEPDNYYQNHRGLVEGSETDSICGTDDEWGMTADSCDPNYFTYQHSYRCSGAELLTECDPDEDGNLAVSPCTYDFESCVYQPRVHIRDNWGWCTGTCPDGTALNGDDGDNECFDAVGDLSSPDPQSECSYTLYPELEGYTTVDPWVYYNGIITVEE